MTTTVKISAGSLRYAAKREREHPMVLRSLVGVGGDRPGRKYLRKRNAQARRYGFSGIAEMAMAALKRAAA